MPEGFSFQGDIAPMRGSFFQSGLSSREGSYLAKKYGPDKDDMKDMLTMQARMASIRNSDLAYQTNLESLQEKREDARRKREQDARIGQISNNLIGITSGEGSPEDRAEGLANYRLENPELFNTPSSNSLYTAATGKINAEKTRIAKEQAKLDKKTNFMGPAIESGNIAAVKSRAKTLGLSEEETAQYIASAQSFKDSGIQAATQRAAQSEYAKFEVQDLKEAESDLDAIGKELKAAYIHIDKTNAYQTDPEMSPSARAALEYRLAEFTDRKPEDVRAENLTDEKLRSNVEGFYDQLSQTIDATKKSYRLGKYKAAGYTTDETSTTSQRSNSSLQNRTGL